MTRKLVAFGTLVASCMVAAISAVAVTPNTEQPDMIGTDQPVFLGRMVVTATPLPAE